MKAARHITNRSCSVQNKQSQTIGDSLPLYGNWLLTIQCSHAFINIWAIMIEWFFHSCMKSVAPSGDSQIKNNTIPQAFWKRGRSPSTQRYNNQCQQEQRFFDQEVDEYKHLCLIGGQQNGSPTECHHHNNQYQHLRGIHMRSWGLPLLPHAVMMRCMALSRCLIVCQLRNGEMQKIFNF